MSKVTVPHIKSAYAGTNALNARFDKIVDELNDKVLYRDNPVGEANTMVSDLDMGNNDILNVKMISADDFKVAGENITAGLSEAITAANEAKAATETLKNEASASATSALAASDASKLSEQAAATSASEALASKNAAEAAQTSCEGELAKVTAEGINQVSIVSAEGTRQVGVVQAATPAEITKLTNETPNQIKLVSDEGANQVGRVQLEGDTQVARASQEADRAKTEADNLASTVTQVETNKVDINSLSTKIEHACIIKGATTGSPDEIQDSNLGNSSGEIARRARYILTNPFGINTPVIVVAEIYANGVWADMGWRGDGSGQGHGCRVSYVQGTGIVIQTGYEGIVTNSANGGGGHGLTSESTANARCRVQVWRVKA